MSQRNINYYPLRGALLLASLLLSSGAHAWESGKLLIWINGDKGHKGLQKLADEFTKKTGIPAKVEHPDDAPNKFTQVGGTKAGPDVWIWPHDRIGEWIGKGLLNPVKPTPALQEEIVNVGWDAFMVEGKQWGYPIAVEAISLIYNKDLLPNPPKAFEDIPALNDKLKARGVRAIGWEYTSPYFSWPLMAANGGFVFPRDTRGNYQSGETGVNKTGAVIGAEMLVTLIDKGVLPANGMAYADAERSMKEGRQAMFISGPWAWDGLRAAKINFGVAPLPSIKGKPAKPFVGVLGAMISARTPNQPAAINFIENFLLKPDGLRKVNEDVPIGVPAHKGYFWELYNDEKIRASMDAVHSGKPMPHNPEMNRFWGAMSTALQQMTTELTTRKKPQEALDQVAKTVLSK
ncbi:maltose/maltodextrin ABC transporter substrate-binding protein MalE [Chitinivorax sp. B]|uniref:maltose/maltodextrin ABC transporter substrate-binding protein MalE n=1 Tax=Chitinivorax sp. B TaxID=2502235 RepID=UPI0010F45825|nr:maltose/maltodextrin ABC transporter substrate-binding protein MalE [Chitinivorax sp. B]